MKNDRDLQIPPKDDIPHLILQAKHFIEKNYYRDIRVTDIAASAHLSSSHLNRKFKEYFSMTPYQYMICVRLDQARLLIRQKELSINQIVNDVGFYSASSFIRLYKKRFGVTPGRLRPKK